ncbi:MFS transporter, partial [Streptomyces olivaceoviridis]
LGALVGHLSGWRTAFLVAAVAALLSLVLLGTVLPALRPTEAVRLTTLGKALRTWPVVYALLATAFVFLGHFSAYTYVTPYLQQHAHVSPRAVTAVLLGYGLAGLAGNLLAGAASGCSLRAVTVVTAALLAAAILLLTVLTGAVDVVLFVLLWGAAFGAVPLIAQVRVMRAFPQAYDAAPALLVRASQTFLATGSLLGGLLTDRHGPTAAFFFGALAVLVSALIPLRLPAGR